MYCVIQQVMRKKPGRHGEPLEIIAYQNQWRLDESKPFTWAWMYSEERFERPHLEAYKITLHQSYREGGRVRKRQYSICTLSYYDIVEWCLYDCADRRIKAAAEKIGVDLSTLYDLIDARLEPLRERLEAEFHQSPEYIAKQEHERIRADYLEASSKFCSRYNVDKDEFARCYDIFLTLRNKDYLEQIKAAHKARKQSESSYREYFRSSYGGYTSGSYSFSSVSTYTEDESETLKQFYRVLAKKFHPDVNPGTDTTKQMQLLNRLKESWGI